MVQTSSNTRGIVFLKLSCWPCQCVTKINCCSVSCCNEEEVICPQALVLDYAAVHKSLKSNKKTARIRTVFVQMSVVKTNQNEPNNKQRQQKNKHEYYFKLHCIAYGYNTTNTFSQESYLQNANEFPKILRVKYLCLLFSF